jgi:hypothetical protein
MSRSPVLIHVTYSSYNYAGIWDRLLVVVGTVMASTRGNRRVMCSLVSVPSPLILYKQSEE